MLCKIGHFANRPLSPFEWAFCLFHTVKDTEDDWQRERVRQRDHLALEWLIAHNPDAAKREIQRPIAQEAEVDDEAAREQREVMFMLSDPHFNQEPEAELPTGLIAQLQQQTMERMYAR